MRKVLILTSLRRRKQEGIVLIVGLIMVLLISIVAMAAIRGSGLQEAMAGNMRNRNLAFQAAESGLSVGESIVDVELVAVAPVFSGKQGWSFCNVSTSATGHPVLRIAEGRYRQWSALEGDQCQFETSSLTPGSGTTVTVKVEACVTGKEAETSARCRRYVNGSTTVFKPSGLLQKYGEDASIKFSLTSGTYKANLKGGVVRSPAGYIAGNTDSTKDEISLTTGVFNSSVSGIINNINKFRIGSYTFAGSGNYLDCNTHSIPISDVKSGATDGRRCSDWGNPLAEIYLEMLRYISGRAAATTAFNVDDSTAWDSYPGISGLTRMTWNSSSDPWPADQWCAKCSAIVISTGANSFDSDNLGTATDLAGITAVSDITDKTDAVGNQEFGGTFSGNYFMGGTVDGQRYCKSTSVTKLSDIRGICPESPALEGSYNIAGLAYYARTTDLRTASSNGPDGKTKQTLTTYAVDLAESMPSFKVPVGTSGSVSFIPACESNTDGNAVNTTTATAWQSCTLIDVKVESISSTSGSFLFYWEDSLWGNDHDLDVAQRITFCVGSACGSSSGVASDEIQIRNTIVYAAAGNALRLSYSVYGVSSATGNLYIAPAQTVSGSFSGGMVYPWSVRPGGINYDNAIDNESNIPTTVGYSVIKYQAAASNSTVLLKKPLYYAAKYGGFTDTNGNDRPDLTAEWDNYQGSADGVPDNFFSVKNPALLQESLENVFDAIIRSSTSASAVATSSTRLDQDDYVYQAVFDSKAWSGELRAYRTDAAGVLPAEPTIRTKNTMPTSSTGRNVYTYFSDNTIGTQNTTDSPVTNKSTRLLTWANLHSTQQNKLKLSTETSTTNAQKRLNWLLGNSTDENNVTGLRVRNSEDSNGTSYRNILGDIVNSGPAYMGGYDHQYNLLPSAQGGSTYQTHLIAKRAKTPQIFVGANDGMLHAFNANTLTESFAYVPNMVFSDLYKLTQPTYGSTSNPHKYYVDGPIAVGDVYTGGAWRSIVVGSLGAGGKGIYALDVTGSTPQVLFEYANASLGHVTGKFFIAPTAAGRWVVVVGNGSDSGTTSKLFLIDIELPFSNTIILDTGAGTGLSAPAILLDATNRVSNVYAGDLSGNLWRFNLTDSTSSNWSNSTNTYRVFRAVDASSNAQPITASPTIGYNDILNQYMVYFGTGKYIDTTDGAPTTNRQSFYAVPDMGSSSAAVTRSGLLQKTLTSDYSAQTRTVSTANPNWSTQKGWYIDLDNSSSLKLDERVTSKALLIQDKLLITTLIPSQVACEAGGKSWVMEVPAVGDKYVNSHVLPTSVFANELFLGDQSVVFLGNGKKLVGSSGGASSATTSLTSACTSGGKSKLSLIDSGTSGAKPKAVDASMDSCLMGRQSWRQLR